jgi:hypothetical protein
VALAANACDSAKSETTTAKTGTVQMALTAVGSDGDTYRLRNAMLHIDGPTTADVELDEAYGDSPLFEARVDTGEYKITLDEGWVLQRHNGESFEVVEARLLTQNPLKFEVKRNATTTMALVFETVDGESEFATGELEVWLAVNHLDCEAGEYVTRSCGANLTGRQFNMCDAGWWQGWSECSARCDRGYCLFKDPATFAAATTDKTVETVGFETYATGSPVPAEIFSAIYGDVFSDQVNFVSIGVSNQMFPWDSDDPFAGQKHDVVVIHGGNDSGEATLRSSAGAHNFSGFDGIEAIFPATTGADDNESTPGTPRWMPVDTPAEIEVYAMAITVDNNAAGYTIAIHNEDCTVVAELPVSSGDGHSFIILGNAEYRDIVPASSVVITPSASDASPHGTAAWAMTEFAYAY